MASINFLYRSSKPKAYLNLRFLHRHNNKDIVLGAKSKIEVTKEYWTKHHTSKRIKDIDIKNTQTDINNKISKLEEHLIKVFRETNIAEVNKEWLKNNLENYYNPKQQTEIPTTLVNFIDYFLELKKAETIESKRKRLITTKNKMIRLEKELGHKIQIIDINEQFKTDYVNFSVKHNYAQNTQQRELSRIKTICNYAKYIGIETHHQLDKLSLQKETVNHVYLTFDELEKINNTALEHDYLNNAKDWLIISCYTGQRVSDFMKFTTKNIREEKGKKLLEFTQQKTGKIMTIPLLKEVEKILNSRNWNFPRAISDQKYNDYIKQVCKLSGINEICKGKIRTNTKEKATRYDIRALQGEYPKHELVSSHIGRRSFATNHYGKVPTTYLIGITGHSTEKQFLNYIKKSNKDLVMDSFDYFE